MTVYEQPRPRAPRPQPPRPQNTRDGRKPDPLPRPEEPPLEVVRDRSPLVLAWALGLAVVVGLTIGLTLGTELACRAG